MFCTEKKTTVKQVVRFKVVVLDELCTVPELHLKNNSMLRIQFRSQIHNSYIPVLYVYLRKLF